MIVLPRWADFSGYLASTRSAPGGDELPAVLRSALARRATRGAAPVIVQDKPWGVTTVDLFVTSEDR